MALQKTSPWPFIGMSGMACAFFLYAASGLVAPWWGVTILMLLWVVMFVIGCTWWTRYPRRLLILPFVAVALWFGLITAGAIWFDWSA